MIQIATPDDLSLIASCHMKAFPTTLSSRLGVSLVKKMLSWYLDSPKRFLFYIKVDNACIGYCGGTISDGTQVHGSASGMIQHSFKDAFHALLMRPWLWFHPDLRSRYKLILKNIYFKATNYNRPVSRRTIQPIDPHAGLIVIGVDPAYQGQGYASILLKEFERISREKGILKLMLTVLTTNEQAIIAYRKNGWMVFETKQKSTLMVKYLS